MSANCPWYSRWWHRRKREADTYDIAVRYLACYQVGMSVAEGVAEVDEWKRLVPHWNCPCAERVAAVQRQGRTR